MDEDGIKLTSYFGERRRAEDRSVADALVALYREYEIASSIVLPLTAIAVDASSRIRAVLDQTRRINHQGLVTMERTRFLSGDIEPEVPPETAGDVAAKLTVYFCRHDTVFGVPAFEAMCELLHRRNIGGATALAGIDGTAQGRRLRNHFMSRGADAPMMVVAVGASKTIEPLLAEIGGLFRYPRMTLDQVQVCKRDGELISEPENPPPYDEDGLHLWQKLTVYASEASRHDGQPLHRFLVRRLLAAGSGGATTQRGTWGYRGQHAPHGDQHLLQFTHHVPAVTAVMDTSQRISTAFAIIDELTAEHGLVTCENVPTMAPATI